MSIAVSDPIHARLYETYEIINARFIEVLPVLLNGEIYN